MSTHPAVLTTENFWDEDFRDEIMWVETSGQGKSFYIGPKQMHRGFQGLPEVG